MGGRDHSCEVCGRGGLNDPDGVCVCPDAGYAQAIRDVVEALRDVGGKSWTSRLPEAADFIESRFGSSPETPMTEKRRAELIEELIAFSKDETALDWDAIEDKPNPPSGVEDKYRGLAGKLGEEANSKSVPSTSKRLELGADRALRERLMEALRAVPRNSDTPYYLALADAALAAIEAQREGER